LIDELGGLERALSIAREMAGLPKDTPVVLEGTTESIFESLLLGPEPGAQEVQVALDRFLQRRWEATTQWSLGEHLKELRPFAAFVAPLLAGETVVTAVPFSLRLK
jgi:protease-4